MAHTTDFSARLALAATAAWLVWGTVGASAQTAAPVAAPATTHRIKSGDTLWQIAADKFKDPQQWGLLQRLNGMLEPRKLRPGTELLLFEMHANASPFPATVFNVAGEAWLVSDGTHSGGGPTERKALVPGDRLSAGALLRSGAQSFISLVMGDGSTVVLPSQSEVRLLQAPLARSGGQKQGDPILPVARFELRQGRVESRVTHQAPGTVPVDTGRGEPPAPLRSRNNVFEVQTPAALLGVRGTHFRVWWDADKGGAETLDGTVVAQFATPAVDDITIAAGTGLALYAGSQTLLPLLPAPEPLTLTPDSGTVRIVPVPGALKYRGQVARDPDFLLLVQEQLATEPLLHFQDLPPDLYHLRLTAVDKDGMDGLPGTAIWFYQPLVRESGIRYRSDGGLEVRWPTADGTRSHFQLARDRAFTDIVLDETHVYGAGMQLNRLQKGRYFWRVMLWQPQLDRSEKLVETLVGDFETAPASP